MKHHKPGEKIALKLTTAERTLLLDGSIILPPAFVRLIECTPPSEPVMFPPNSLVALGTYVGGAVNRKMPNVRSNALLQKILGLLSDHRTVTEVKALTKTKLRSGRATTPAKKPARTKKDKHLYQFKITLIESHPPIWRRIQVPDCTLDKMHEHIQTAMGWTNSHLHQFKVGDERYADPMLMEEDFEEFGYDDSTTTLLGYILPTNGKRFSFVYEYDFGDSWDHEVLFEGVVQAEAKVKYPLCLEGARACPPEDCGGIWGYADFLEAISNKKHEQHEELLEWIGGRFDPEEFDPAKATKAMKKGLPD